MGDGNVRFDSVLIMFVSVRGWIVLCWGSLYKGFEDCVGCRMRAANTICVMWVYMPFLWRCQVNFICNNDRGRENHFQMSNCVFCLMPGIDRMVLISCTGICLKVAFDLNFNLQTEAGEKDPFILFQQHNKMSCLSATIYHHWWGTALVGLLT